MSIRFRLVLSYIAMLIIPIFLSGIAVMIVTVAFLGDLKSLYQVDIRHQNPIWEVMEQEASVAADIQLRGKSEPETLLKPEVTSQLEERLLKVNMELIVRKNADIVYVSDKMNNPQLLNHLPSYGESGEKEYVEKGRGHWLIVRQLDLVFSDKSPGSVFIVTDMNFLGKFAHKYSSLLLISLFVIFVLTNVLLTYFMSRSIIRPLKSLKRAAEEIKEGNLNYEVRPQSNDEIGDLSISFEQMRRRLKQSVELQLQYEENRKELISNISHDLKTPVTAIKGYVEGIIDGVTNSPEKLDKYVRTIYTKAGQMDQLIDELFLFSKLDLKKLPFHFEQVELTSYLQDCIDELYVDMDKKGVSLMLDTSGLEGPVSVVADRDKLKRVLINIIDNAVKYMGKEHGSVFLRIRERKETAVVEIEDNGHGIDAETLPHIFNRFYRGDPSRNAGTGGSGLGLAIAKQIIEEHGGEIWANSTVGEGTRIFVSLRKIHR